MSRYSNRKWVIITLSDYNNEELNNLVQNSTNYSIESVKKNLNGTKAVLKWDGDTPTCFNGMTTYTHSQILIELAKSEWINE